MNKQGSGHGADALVVSLSLEDLLARGDVRSALGLPHESSRGSAGAASVSASASGVVSERNDISGVSRPADDGVWEYPQNSTAWTSYETSPDSRSPSFNASVASIQENPGFAGFFDMILIDAPCSGSAMFRKEQAPLENWSPSLVEDVTATQRRLIDGSLKLLRRPGGLLVYMTCSFDEAENARHIAWVHSHRVKVNPAIPETGDNQKCFPVAAPLRVIESNSENWGLRAEKLPTKNENRRNSVDDSSAGQGHVVFTGLPSSSRLEGCFAAGIVLAPPTAANATESTENTPNLTRSSFNAPKYSSTPALDTTGESKTPESKTPPELPSSVTISVADTHMLGSYFLAMSSMEAALAATWLDPTLFNKYALLLEFKPIAAADEAERSAERGNAVAFRVECHLYPRAHLPLLQWLSPLRADMSFRELGSNHPSAATGYSLNSLNDAVAASPGGKLQLSRPVILAPGHHIGTMGLELDAKYAQYVLSKLQKCRSQTNLAVASKSRNIKLKTDRLAFLPSQQLALESSTFLHPIHRNKPVLSLTRAEAMAFTAQVHAMRAWTTLSAQTAAILAIQWAFTRYATTQLAGVIAEHGQTTGLMNLPKLSSSEDILSCRRLLSTLRLFAAVEEEALQELALGAVSNDQTTPTDEAPLTNYTSLIAAAVNRAEHAVPRPALGADILNSTANASTTATVATSGTSHVAHSSTSTPDNGANDIFAAARACVDTVAVSNWSLDAVAVRQSSSALQRLLETLLEQSEGVLSEAASASTATSARIASWLRAPATLAALRPAVEAAGWSLPKEARAVAASAVNEDVALVVKKLSNHVSAADADACKVVLTSSPSAELWSLLTQPDVILPRNDEDTMPSVTVADEYSANAGKLTSLYGPLEQILFRTLHGVEDIASNTASSLESEPSAVAVDTSSLAGTVIGAGTIPNGAFVPLSSTAMLDAATPSTTSTEADARLDALVASASASTPLPWVRAMLKASAARNVLSLAALHSTPAREGAIVLATCDGLPVGWVQRQGQRWVSLAPKAWRIAKYQSGQVLLDMLAFGEERAKVGLGCVGGEVGDGEEDVDANQDRCFDDDSMHS